ncbi:hypothetical protein PPYR_07109 [Photinus pyralis]|uniref:RWD domain-containing protein n=2 Tax=Photinus pyralis TaxID=7054 RepID=A0A5N4APH5_PHOPY|nr:protein IMPACT-like [Photinus pyralis]KAB0799229.1 hypothetical protein PPYR_07109 [Photinus pyralis]
MNDDKVEQINELEALSAIYGSEWHEQFEIDNCYYICVGPDVQLSVTLPLDYPSKRPPLYELLAPTLTKEQKAHISREFDEIYRTNCGSPVLFQWIEKLKEIVHLYVKEIKNTTSEEVVKEAEPPTKLLNFNIIHGTTVEDRKSIFQGHTCTIHAAQDVRDVTELLLQNKKISHATHNITAYRITTPNGNILQDCDDDGETHAGGRLLHLLQILNVVNVYVMVSRWYGGIQLGPDRFRHINNAARQVLQEANFIPKKD